jgi:hypothetical protein
MNLKEIRNKFKDRFMAHRAHGLIGAGNRLIETTVQGGAVDKRAIDLFRSDPQVLTVLDLEDKKAQLAGQLTLQNSNIEDEKVLYSLIDQNEEMIALREQAFALKRKLSMAQLGALLELQGEKLESEFKKHGL